MTFKIPLYNPCKRAAHSSPHPYYSPKTSGGRPCLRSMAIYISPPSPFPLLIASAFSFSFSFSLLSQHLSPCLQLPKYSFPSHHTTSHLISSPF
ncbi:hypothetical protein BDW02DRAFT_433190 [Decorospora gaudefroyi]|uniref:Uncharacterized protein n=1 Tax=Decorospora gaudefroyi TaxID=184978 RepID=A0A6A5KG21_9PLEO|nr:hypothetical protein BDW02DRAFT_433190 [Decorospora gaudefroyi]